MAPEKDVSFETIATKFKEHFESKTNVIVERFKFHNIKHNGFQPARDFIMELRKQAAKCNFGDTCDHMIRDQVVIGVYNESTRKRLLANAKLTLLLAIDNLKVEEQVERDAKHFSHHPNFIKNYLQLKSSKYNQSKVRNTRQSHNNLGLVKSAVKEWVCCKCGIDHGPNDKCPAAGSTCNYYHGIGHWELEVSLFS